MVTPLYTSFYTPDYAEHAARLIASFKAHELPYVVVRAPAFSSWQAATHHKPAHLISMRQHHPGRPLVWIDADARIVQKPTLFDALTDDIAAYYHRNTELWSGTVYVGATQAGDNLLRAWRDGCHDTPDVLDQQVLQRVLGDTIARIGSPDQPSSSLSGIRSLGLPADYCHVGSIMTGAPVIAHKMASLERK